MISICLKLTCDGNEEWSRTFGGDRYDWGWSVEPTDDNGFIVCGTTDSYGAGDGDILVLKTSNQGQMQWYRTYGGTARKAALISNRPLTVVIIICGVTNSYVPVISIFLVKTDHNGMY